MVDSTGRARWRGGTGGLGPLGGGKSASFTPPAKQMGKKDLGEPEFGLRAHSTEWWRPAASPGASPRASPIRGVAQPAGQPDSGGGSARFRAWLSPTGGWLGPIGGVAQPDLAGGWPGGRRLSHPPDRAQTTTYGAMFLSKCWVPCSTRNSSARTTRRNGGGVRHSGAALPHRTQCIRRLRRLQPGQLARHVQRAEAVAECLRGKAVSAAATLPAPRLPRV